MASLVPSFCELVSDYLGRQHLFHKYTHEVVALPIRPGEDWRLDENESSVPWVECGDEEEDDGLQRSLWAADLFERNCYIKDEEVWVSGTGIATPLLLKTYEGVHTVWQTGIPRPGNALGSSFIVYRFDMMQSGLRWWWTLPTLVSSLIHAFLRGKSKLSKITNKRMKAWVALASNLGCAPIRRARVQDGRDPLVIPNEPHRCLSKATASTVHLVAIVQQLAFKKPEAGGICSQHGQEAAVLFLEGLVLRSGLQRLVVRLDCECPFHPGGFLLAAGKACTLPIEGLNVDIAPLFAQLPKLYRKEKNHVLKITELCGFPQSMRTTLACTVPIRTFLQVLVSQSSTMVKDMTFGIAQAIEAVLEGERLEWMKEKKTPSGAAAVHLCRVDSTSIDQHEMARLMGT